MSPGSSWMIYNGIRPEKSGSVFFCSNKTNFNLKDSFLFWTFFNQRARFSLKRIVNYSVWWTDSAGGPSQNARHSLCICCESSGCCLKDLIWILKCFLCTKQSNKAKSYPKQNDAFSEVCAEFLDTFLLVLLANAFAAILLGSRMPGFPIGWMAV